MKNWPKISQKKIDSFMFIFLFVVKWRPQLWCQQAKEYLWEDIRKGLIASFPKAEAGELSMLGKRKLSIVSVQTSVIGCCNALSIVSLAVVICISCISKPLGYFPVFLTSSKDIKTNSIQSKYDRILFWLFKFWHRYFLIIAYYLIHLLCCLHYFWIKR